MGTNVTSFFALLVVKVVVAAVYHRALRYRFLEGMDSFLAKVSAGWVGDWPGSPVLGHKLWNIQSAYLVPAILGAIASVDLSALCWNSQPCSWAPGSEP